MIRWLSIFRTRVPVPPAVPEPAHIPGTAGPASPSAAFSARGPEGDAWIDPDPAAPNTDLTPPRPAAPVEVPSAPADQPMRCCCPGCLRADLDALAARVERITSRTGVL